jgi:hypothetical protein
MQTGARKTGTQMEMAGNYACVQMRVKKKNHSANSFAT